MGNILLVIKPGIVADSFYNKLSADFGIIMAKDEEEAVGILDDRFEEISAVIVDHDIAKKSGHSIIKRLNEEILYASIPAIIAKKEPPTEEEMKYFSLGYSDLLFPPLFSEQIIKRVNNAIRAKDSYTYSEMQKMLRELPVNIFLKDSEGKYVFSTQYWHHLKQDGEHWTIRGKTDLDIRKDKQNALKAMEADKEIIRTGKGTNYIIEECEDGTREFLELIKRPVRNEEGEITGIIAIINNVTETQLLKMELEERSRTDSLTGLLNKGALEELVRMMLSNYHKEGDHSALMMIDVDRFKSVNDVYGHAVGDHVLSAVGRIIYGSFKGKDVAGRVGGDEFIVFLRGIESENDIMHLADNLEKEVMHAFDGEECEGCATLSIGISQYPKNGVTFEELYAAADKALYYVKEHGRGTYRIVE